jgi:hypothetical protein
MKISEGDRHFPQEDYAVPDARNKRIAALEAERLRLMAEVITLRENLARATETNERILANVERARRRRATKVR